jgi:hypothetical protein
MHYKRKAFKSFPFEVTGLPRLEKNRKNEKDKNK